VRILYWHDRQIKQFESNLVVAIKKIHSLVDEMRELVALVGVIDQCVDKRIGRKS
jgi:hypothetical protein